MKAALLVLLTLVLLAILARAEPPIRKDQERKGQVFLRAPAQVQMNEKGESKK